VAGVWGVTFVVVLVNVLLLEAARRGRAAWRPAATLVPPGAVALLPSLIPLPAAAGPRLDVAVVQGNVPLALASDRLLQTSQVV